MVRQDLEKKGYLPPNGKIMLFATSGGGILIQQYLAKHGEHVSRVLLEAKSIMVNYCCLSGMQITSFLQKLMK